MDIYHDIHNDYINVKSFCVLRFTWNSHSITAKLIEIRQIIVKNMGGFFAKALEKIMGKKEMRILMVGLDAAGKKHNNII